LAQQLAPDFAHALDAEILVEYPLHERHQGSIPLRPGRASCRVDPLGRMSETSPKFDLAMFPDVGHFPHPEDPDRAASEISDFFARLA